MIDHPDRPVVPAVIAVRGAREHNLRSVNVDIPRGALTVVTGVSGSGKSSLAFDTIGVEGRRRYLETFSSYARQYLGRLSRPAASRIDGLSPVVAVDQSTVVRNPRSTVGTMTELYDLLRLLWARLGTASDGASAPLHRQLFSFNSPHGACPACSGLGVEDRLDPELLVADPARTVRGGALRLSTPNGYLIYSQVTIDVLDQVCRAHGFTVDVPWRDLTAGQRDVILNGSDRIRIPYGKHPLESRMRWTGITAKPREEGIYKGILPVMEQILRQKRNDNVLRFVRSMPCRACGGTRLRPEALAVTFRGLTIAGAAAMTIADLRRWFESDSGHDSPHYIAIRDHALARCRILEHLGLGYLTLDRVSTTMSAGESQRIRLSRQAHLGLSGLLYVLDEPSVGLHPKDTATLIGVLEDIRDQGNTVLVVEHDEDTIRAADWIVDVGPGAGKAGGRILFSGPARAFESADEMGVAAGLDDGSPTRAFLSGRASIPVPTARRPGLGTITVSGLTAHNLAGIDATFLMGALNVVAGVSGAGKSTLVRETRRLLGNDAGCAENVAPAEAPMVPGGAAARPSRAINKIIEIDQDPIGRTPRSNPATYTGLFDAVRDLFAAEPEAVRLGFGKGRFSFNVAGGRCEACEGAGLQQFGMQFLGTVAVVCESCGGRRFNDATLAVTYRGLTIHDVLELSIEDACTTFADHPAISRVLKALCDLGLGYLPLGHPATMLSGGEAQRIKLAAELARPAAASTLYILDEPTTGLHATDVARLLSALTRLVEMGHSVIVIEHHLDVVAAADRVIDLGPGSGPEGGRVVVAGTPEDVARSPLSATGAALRDHFDRRRGAPGRERDAGAVPLAGRDRAGHRRALEAIRFTNVSTHNLQHVDVEIPHNRLTVITGVSGSGKSSFAFDTLFAEGQQRFAGSFDTYARRFVQRADEAEFDEVSGLVPTIAISQHAPSRNPRSTVATLTEVHDSYRLLFSRVGARHCPECDAPLGGLICPSCGFSGRLTLTASMFSPNSEIGACPACHGLGSVMACDPGKLITDPTRALAGGAMDGHKAGRAYGDSQGQHMAALAAAARLAGVDVSLPWNALSDDARHLALYGSGDRQLDVEWAYQRGARRGVHRFKGQWVGLLELARLEYDRTHGDRRGDAIAPLMTAVNCQACGGSKLRPEALAVRVAGLNIHELLTQTVEQNLQFFGTLEAGNDRFNDRAREVSLDLRADIVRRLGRLRDAGVSYLALDRLAVSLSGGEAQRVRLAASLQSGLTGVCYVLDEPTVGLHARDTARLLGLLRDLREAGNTVVVVEHDIDVIAAADHVIELGPGAGRLGGRVIATGTPAEIAQSVDSVTGPYLSVSWPASLDSAEGRNARPGRDDRRALVPGITIRGARVHNLDGLDIDIPARGLVAITGVSGSGKSSLVFDVLAPSLERVLHAPAGSIPAPVNCGTFALHAGFTSLVNVGAAAAGASPWSTPATLVGVFDTIRDVFAATDEARSRGLRKTHFSTATRGGRCETCQGLGRTRISMDFLPDVWVRCEDCDGRRFGPDVLACTIEGRSIADVLDMAVDEAIAFFDRHAAPRPARVRLAAALGVLQELGLGYLQIGQPSRTLSGGERQRLVAAAALTDTKAGPGLYVLDEPTTGLHMQDVGRLLTLFRKLTAAGHTVIVVEHHLAVIADADWVIDLGPEGGSAGGRVVVAGTPATVAACPGSWTGQALAGLGVSGV